MKLLLLSLIRLYWVIPKKKRRQCLFKCNCSRHVYQITSKQGFLAGIRALKERYRQCKPGYAIYEIDGIKWVILKDSSVVKKDLTTL